jgi:serine O-acetyltransferase
MSDDIATDLRRLLREQPALARLGALDPAAIQTEACALAATLAGLVPDLQARAEVLAMGTRVFSQDGPREAALEDLQATAERDVGTGGMAPTLLFAHGFHGLLAYRLSRALWLDGQPSLAFGIKALFARLLSIDIAPQATLGRRTWLDHGHGTVIGATAELGDDVCLWHGVTLGSNLSDRGERRHPRIGARVVIGANATILGGIEIGADAVIAAGAVVTRPVGPGETVAGPRAAPIVKRPDGFRGFTRPEGV